MVVVEERLVCFYSTILKVAAYILESLEDLTGCKEIINGLEKNVNCGGSDCSLCFLLFELCSFVFNDEKQFLVLG